jgi:predicted RNA-binding protein with PIN domain
VSTDGAGDQAEQVLADLPAPLWNATLRAVRRVAERVPASELPSVLRPFARFKPERMLSGPARAGVIAALAGDQDLRTSLGEHLDPPEAYAAAESADPGRLAAAHGEDIAVAALIAHGRWDSVAVVAAAAAQRRSARERAAAESAARDQALRAEQSQRRLSEELATARAEREVARQRAVAAEQGQRREAAQRRRLEERVGELEAEVAALHDRLRRERERAERRQERLRRRVAEAQAAARIDGARVREVLSDLDALSARLRTAVDPDEAAGRGEVAGREDESLPRAVPAATAGRPCGLPPGIAPDSAGALEALVQVAGLQVLVDGYNVSLHADGRRAVALQDQRLWLEQVAAALVARYRCRIRLVFDGRDHSGAPHTPPRGVQVLFTAEGESADDRIIELLEAAPEVPTLVVTGDRELVARCTEAGANVLSSAAFLDAAA